MQELDIAEVLQRCAGELWDAMQVAGSEAVEVVALAQKWEIQASNLKRGAA